MYILFGVISLIYLLMFIMVDLLTIMIPCTVFYWKYVSKVTKLNIIWGVTLNLEIAIVPRVTLKSMSLKIIYFTPI